MKRTFRFLGTILLVLASSALHSAANEFFFKANDRVLFLGDSITEQYQYSTDLELYLTTRFPTWNLTFINAGIGGDRAQGGMKRFQEHVLSENPTAITINFGMNDAGYGKFDETLQKPFLDGIEAMLKMAHQAGVRVALVSPNAVDRRVQERFRLYLETQKQFYAPLKMLATNHNATFVDQYAKTRSGLEKMEAEQAASVIPFGDGFHTSSNGGLFMAHAILTGMNAPALVSHVRIDATIFGRGTGSNVNNCSISDEAKTDHGVRFDRVDQALPLPVQPEWFSLLPYVNHLEDLNRYGLAVSGLAPGKYSIKIDGVDVAIHSNDELEQGVNLGNVTAGPIYNQAQNVLEAINAKNKIVHSRFRSVVMASIPDWLSDVAAERKPRELAQRSDQINALQSEIYRMVKPIQHRFEVVMLVK
ncbi:MAG: SGNH/GDSL hydrolase family protein [Planctomycetales bacterium]|jgi:lysophospholipase L1-like esterase|nr:SGNH/GDSL hydrolase family protein [Planctomycetales bacterium]